MTGVETALVRLGIEVVAEMGSELRAYCPGHKSRVGRDDKNPSWYINSETGAHICFSCGFKGSLSYLVCFMNGYFTSNGADLEKGKEWLGSFDQGLSAALAHAQKSKPLVFEDLAYLSESSLAGFSEVPDGPLMSRGLTRAAAAAYGVKWDSIHENWILPVRNPYTGALMGWQEKGHRSRYFKNCPSGMKKSASVFGMENYSGGDLIVVESPLDAVRLLSVGVTGGVAVYGALLSREQLNIIKGAERIIFALDNDEAGMSSADSLAKKSLQDNYDPWFFNYDYTDQKDIGGMSKAEIVTGLDNAKHLLRYLHHRR